MYLWVPLHDTDETSWVLFRGIALVALEIYFPGLIMEIWNSYWWCDTILLVSTFHWLLIFNGLLCKLWRSSNLGGSCIHFIFFLLLWGHITFLNIIISDWILNISHYLFGQIFKDLSVKKVFEPSSLFKQYQNGSSMTSLAKEWSAFMLNEISVICSILFLIM